ncbi:polyprotein [Bienertia sinuspersici]
MMVIGIVEMRSLKCVDVKEIRNEGGRFGGGRCRGYRRGHGQGGANREFPNKYDTFANENGVSAAFKEDRDRQTERRGGYGGPRGVYGGGFGNGEVAKLVGEIKRDGAGRGN